MPGTKAMVGEAACAWPHCSALAIARLAPATSVIPVALRYEFGETERPVAYVSIGAPVRAEGNRRAREEACERAVEAELDGIDDALVRRDLSTFVAPLRGNRQPAKDIAQRLLASSARGPRDE